MDLEGTHVTCGHPLPRSIGIIIDNHNYCNQLLNLAKILLIFDLGFWIVDLGRVGLIINFLEICFYDYGFLIMILLEFMWKHVSISVQY
jgi:hypothetical protein